MLYLAFALIVIAGIGAATYLVISGHPWFALAVLLVIASTQMRHSDDKSEDKADKLPDLSKVVKVKK